MANTNNYAQTKAKYGGYIGSIQTHATPYLTGVNDSSTTPFKLHAPAGFLLCDGSIKNANDYIALSQVLGVGSESKFRKDNVTLREPDDETGDLGQFQLPDLGSKVIVASRSVGDYENDFVGDSELSRVGPSVEVLCNEGTQLTCDFLGNFEGRRKQVDNSYDFQANVKFQFPALTSSAFLDIENFQGHTHRTDATYINFSTNHQVGGDGKESGADSGNSGAYNVVETTELNTSESSSHQHKLGKPNTYTHNFAYSFDPFQIPADNVSTTLNVGVEDITKLDNVVTPFIVVTYIIKM